jgi:hypothetical protein
VVGEEIAFGDAKPPLHTALPCGQERWASNLRLVRRFRKNGDVESEDRRPIASVNPSLDDPEAGPPDGVAEGRGSESLEMGHLERVVLGEVRHFDERIAGTHQV